MNPDVVIYVGLPAAVALALVTGLGVWWRRHRRKPSPWHHPSGIPPNHEQKKF